MGKASPLHIGFVGLTSETKRESEGSDSGHSARLADEWTA